jgi:hypothetical protein
MEDILSCSRTGWGPAPRRRIAFAESGNTITDTMAAPTRPAAVLARISPSFTPSEVTATTSGSAVLA